MRRPRVIINFAMTADGKVSTRNHTPSGFTSARDKQRLLEIRALGDAVLVGIGTAEKDNMSMTIPNDALRGEREVRGQAEHPLRVLISNSGKIPTTLKVFSNQAVPILIFSTEKMPADTQHALEPLAQLHLFPDETVPLPRILSELRAKHQVRTLVCEGGPTLAKSLFAEDLVDEIYLTIAPKIFGGLDAPTVTGAPGSFLPAARQFKLKSLTIENDEAYCHYVRKTVRKNLRAVGAVS